MAGKLQDLTGNIYGELTVEKLHSKGTGKPTLWTCLCTCGNRTNVQPNRLKVGKTTSCGHKKVTHGMYGTATYRSWNAMQQRCTNPASQHYHKYGGAGISMCDRWATFERFYEDMGDRLGGTSLNRVLGSDVYSKETCEWASLSIQSYDQKLDPRNLTGVKGVRWRDERSVWEAIIAKEKTSHRLYYGTDFFEAVCLRKSAELVLYGFGRM